MNSMNEVVQNKFGQLMMAICEAEATIAAKDKEVSGLKAALSDTALRASASNATQDPAQEMLDGR